MARYRLQTLRQRSKGYGAPLVVSLWITASTIEDAVAQAKAVSGVTLGAEGGDLVLTDEQGSSVWTFHQEAGSMPGR